MSFDPEVKLKFRHNKNTTQSKQEQLHVSKANPGMWQLMGDAGSLGTPLGQWPDARQWWAGPLNQHYVWKHERPWRHRRHNGRLTEISDLKPGKVSHYFLVFGILKIQFSRSGCSISSWYQNIFSISLKKLILSWKTILPAAFGSNNTRLIGDCEVQSGRISTPIIDFCLIVSQIIFQGNAGKSHRFQHPLLTNPYVLSCVND